MSSSDNVKSLSSSTIKEHDSVTSVEDTVSKPHAQSASISFFEKKNSRNSFTSEKYLQHWQQHTERAIHNKNNPNFSCDAKSKL